MTPLFSTAYFPSVAYIATLMKYPEIQIETKETFPKQTYRNRMEILTAGGIRALSAPVIRNNHSRTEEVRIDYKERWNIIHLRTIEAAYAASPYYEYYRDDLIAILTPRYNYLLELNTVALNWLLKRLKITTTITPTSDYLPELTDNHIDFRNTFSPKKALQENNFKPYYQVFNDRQPFSPNLSTLDLLMNLGPEAKDYLENIRIF